MGKAEIVSDPDLTFDYRKWGAAIYSRRMELGFADRGLFVDTLYRRTRIRISRHSLGKIERGEKEPKVIQFLAINLCLFGHMLGTSELLNECLSDQWYDLNIMYRRKIATPKHPTVCLAWAEENYETFKAFEDEEELSIASRTQDSVAVFKHPRKVKALAS